MSIEVQKKNLEIHKNMIRMYCHKFRELIENKKSIPQRGYDSFITHLKNVTEYDSFITHLKDVTEDGTTPRAPLATTSAPPPAPDDVKNKIQAYNIDLKTVAYKAKLAELNKVLDSICDNTLYEPRRSGGYTHKRKSSNKRKTSRKRKSSNKRKTNRRKTNKRKSNKRKTSNKRKSNKRKISRKRR